MGRAHCRGPEDGRAIWQQLQGVGKSGTLQNRLSQLSQRVIGHNWTKIQMGKKWKKHKKPYHHESSSLRKAMDFIEFQCLCQLTGMGIIGQC
jgi:hypothetical protein